MEEERKQEQAKKVRFDLKEEIFLIPSKWDRLSKCRVDKSRVTEDLNLLKHKSRAIVGQRNQQNKQGQRKKPNYSSATSGKPKAESANKAAATLDNSRPSSSPNKTVKNSARKTLLDRTLTSAIETKLKIHPRPQRDVSRLEVALPKINYTTDIKKALEKALQRSRSKPALGSVASSSNITSLVTQGKKQSGNFAACSARFEERDRLFQRRLSDSSVFGDKSPVCKHSSGNDSPRFSELSSTDLIGWRPFSAWGLKNRSMRTEKTNPLKRGSSMSTLIPNSILY
ncbi:uncharacterized protein [Montipora foliosa]|uniref:uncharacterized protein n=1 Tax=Montipora foliosa TaxID=591990 RepID=UPI0035F1485D